MADLDTVARLRELLAAATARPWHVATAKADDYQGTLGGEWDYDEGKGEPQASVSTTPKEHGWRCDGGVTGYLIAERNAALIVAAVNALPALLDELEAGRHLLATLDDAGVLVNVVNNHHRGDDINAVVESYERTIEATDAALARLGEPHE